MQITKQLLHSRSSIVTLPAGRRWRLVAAVAPLALALGGCQRPISVQSKIEPLSTGQSTAQGSQDVTDVILTAPSSRPDAGRLAIDPLKFTGVKGQVLPLVIQPAGSGMDVYSKNCASCHTFDPGKKDNGKPVRPGVLDLTDPVVMWKKTPQECFKDLLTTHRSLDPRLASLNSQEIWNAVFYAWSLHSTTDDVVQGGLTFNRNCSVCHGTKGLGDGNLANDLNPAPRRFTDFAWMVDKSDQRFYISINDGRPPSAMPSWKPLLTPRQMIQIINYIRTFTYNYPENITKKMAETPPPS